MKVEVRENASFEFFRFSDFCQRHSGLHRKLHDACAAGRLPHSCCTAGLLAEENCPSQDFTFWKHDATRTPSVQRAAIFRFLPATQPAAQRALKTNGQYNTHMSPYC